MSAQGEDDLEIRLRQDVDTEGTKAAGGLKLVAGGFDSAASAGTKFSSVKTPELVKDSSRLKILAKDLEASARAADQAAASFAKIKSDALKDALKAQEAFARAQDRRQDKNAFQDYLSKEKDFAERALPKSLLAGAAGPKASLFQSLVQSVGRVFGDDAASGLVSGASKLSEAAERLEPVMPALKVGADLLGHGAGLLGQGALTLGGVALALAAAAGAVALKVGAEVTKLAIAETQFKEGAVAALDRLTGGRGEAAFAISLNLAKDLNIDREEAVKRVQNLLQLGFSKTQIPVVVEAIADFGAVKGDEKANSLREKLEKIAAQGKVTQESIKGLAEAGVDVNAVIDRLKKKGESTAEVMARLKAEQISAASAIEAVTSEVESKVGGVARKSGQSIDGLVNAIKISFLDIFAGIDKSPLEGVLKNVKSLLDSESGTKLKEGIVDIGNAGFELLKPFEGEAGKTKLSKLFDQGAQAAHDFAGAIRTIAPALEFLGNGGALGGINAVIETFNLFLPQVKQLLDLIRLVNAIAGNGPAVDTSSASANAFGAGGDIDRGLAAGVDGNSSGVSDAVVRACEDAVGAAKRILGIASPSKVFAGIGRFTAEGFALGVNDNADQAAAAAAGLASSAIGGAGGTGGRGGAGGGAAGSVSITVQVMAAPGMSEADARAMGAVAGDAAFAQWEQHMRRYKRDNRERSAA